MPGITSPITSYSDTTAHRRVITDVISLIDPVDTPLIARTGGLDGATGKFRFLNTPNTMCEWLEDTLYPLVGQLNGALTTNTTTITVDDATMFKEGDIIKIDAELIWVSAIASSTTLTVTRTYGGTNATHADDSPVTIVGQARLEGSESDDRAFTDRSTGYNYTQIFQEEVKVTGTHEKLSQYGIDSELEYQARKLVPSMMRLVEKNCFVGQRKAGSATTPRGAGGLSIFITNNLVNMSSAVITQAKIEEAVKMAFIDGGVGPWIAPTSPNNYEDIKNWYDQNTNFFRVDRQETEAGMVIGRLITAFGDVEFVLDRWADDSNLWVVDPKHCGMLTYRPFAREPLAKSGDYQREEVVGEFTWCHRQDKAHAGVYGIVT